MLGTTVVTDKEDDGFLPKARAVERLKDSSHTCVERAHHGGVGAPFLVLDRGVFFQPEIRSLERGVGCVVGEVEEERLALMLLDVVHGGIGEQVRQVAFHRCGAAVLLEGVTVALGQGPGEIDLEVIVTTAEKTKVEIKTPGQWVMPR